MGWCDSEADKLQYLVRGRSRIALISVKPSICIQANSLMLVGPGLFLYAAGVWILPCCAGHSAESRASLHSIHITSRDVRITNKVNAFPSEAIVFRNSQIVEFNCFSWCLLCKRSFFSLILVLVLFTLCSEKLQLKWISCFGELEIVFWQKLGQLFSSSSMF